MSYPAENDDRIIPARLDTTSATPISCDFDDIYFSPDDGVAESQYHFIDGNRLESRWQQLNQRPHQTTFTIAETGFGTGLNALLSIELWQQTVRTSHILHYITIEKHPISVDALATIYTKNHWHNRITEQLLANYPPLRRGRYQLAFGENIRLTLLFDDAVHALNYHDFVADAWFLDGFAPAKNPSMWSAALFQQMALHSQPQTTFATFTAASAVRKGLMQAGFTVEKSKGFGRKRERLIGHYADIA